MLGLIWANAYTIVFIHDPSSFDLGRHVEATDEFTEIQTTVASRMIYFSFVTITTLGYGDVKPQSEAAETLAILEALTGQVYLVVILARMVSLLIGRRDSG
jgi:voltage-gated potassium channel Kch